MMKNPDKISICFVIAPIFFALGFYSSRLINKQSDLPVTTQEETKKSLIQENINALSFPSLKLPMRYFDYKYLTSYSSCESQNSKDPNCYKYAVSGHFKGPYAYQSYPSTKITIEGYQNFDKQKPLPLDQLLKKVATLKEDPSRDTAFDALFLSTDYINSKYKQFGQIVGNFMPEEDPQKMIKTDVNRDGVDEIIVFTCPSGYSGSSCGTVWVADTKGNLMFKDTDRAIDLDPSEDGNGFYLYNAHTDDSEAFNSERMKYRVRFVYENNEFIPVFQQTIIELDNTGPLVVYYGYNSKISTSGEARFYWYDTNTKKVIDQDNQYSWFWAMPPEKVTSNNELTTKWYEFVHENIDSVFKITGTRGEDDCSYWGPDHCVENIDIQSIEVVGSNKRMQF